MGGPLVLDSVHAGALRHAGNGKAGVRMIRYMKYDAVVSRISSTKSAAFTSPFPTWTKELNPACDPSRKARKARSTVPYAFYELR